MLSRPVVCPAASTLVFEVRPETGAASVMVDGRAVVRVRQESTDTAVNLARVIAKRLNELAESGLAAKALSVQTKDDGAAVYGNGLLICTATPQAAKLSGSTAQGLAASWLANLQNAFDRPYLSVPAPDAVPLDGTLGVALRGHPAGAPVEFRSPAPPGPGGRVEARLNDRGTGFHLTGKQLGPATLTLRRAGAELTLEFPVKLRAGRVVGAVTATVAGLQPPREMVRDAVWSELEAQTERQPGVALQFSLPRRFDSPGPGQTVKLPVAVNLTGGDTIPSAESIDVTLRGSDWADQPAARLLVSNDPESVATTQLLLRGELPTKQLTRLLYHHKTVAGIPLLYELRLLNQSDRPARVLLRDAPYGPNRDEIFVGHQACLGHWRQRLNHQGYVLRLQPRSSWTILSLSVPPGAVMSGLSEFSVLEGEGVEVQVVATSGISQRGPRAIAGATSALWSEIATYPQPQREVEAVYRAGGLYAFINVGRDPVRSLRETPLLGNYGVLYTINLAFENTSHTTQRYELVFSADGGVARGVVVLDGKLRETGLVRPSQQEQLLSTVLPPGGVQRHTIRIIPQSGSNYPLRLVGRPYRPELARRSRP